MSTLQETFDTVARHLLTQGCQAVDEDENCMYRTLSGLRCAAGCLIPDEKYTPDIEMNSIELNFNHLDYRMRVAQVLLRVALEGHDIELVQRLQNIHDNSSVANWPEQLREEASYWGLGSNVVDELEGQIL